MHNRANKAEFIETGQKSLHFEKFPYKLDEIHYSFHTNQSKTYSKHILNDRRHPSPMFGREWRQVDRCVMPE